VSHDDFAALSAHGKRSRPHLAKPDAAAIVETSTSGLSKSIRSAENTLMCGWTWKALAAFALTLAGALAAFAIYTFGWHEKGSGRKSSGRAIPSVRTVGGNQRVYTLRDGDVVLRPEAAVRCEASGEGGIPNLFCTRIGGGRHQVIFYKDTVLVWPLDCRGCGPDGPTFDYSWAPKPRKK
jgi:hypothetical protein